MIGGIGGVMNFAVTSSLARQKAAADAPASSLEPKQTTPSAKNIFLDFMKKTPAQRMTESWLKAHGLTQEKLDKMDPKEREAIMKQMQDDIERAQKAEAEQKSKVDILV